MPLTRSDIAVGATPFIWLAVAIIAETVMAVLELGRLLA